MSVNNTVHLQHQIRENSFDLQSQLLDLVSWETDMKRKDEEIKKEHIVEAGGDLPPVRSITSSKMRRKKKCKSKKKEKGKVPVSHDADKSLNALSSDDSKTQETLDIGEAFPDCETNDGDSSSTEKEDDDLELQSSMLDVYKKKQLATVMKDRGNEFFKAKDYNMAIVCYTSGFQNDPENALLPANRAMAYMKIGELTLAEIDCSTCISIDPTYVKAYLRRGTVRMDLKKFDQAKHDYLKVQELEPSNKQAITELQKIENELSKLDQKDNSSSIVQINNTEKVGNFLPDNELRESKTLRFNNVGLVPDKVLIADSDKNADLTKRFNDSKYADSCVIAPVQKSMSERSTKPLVPIVVEDISLKDAFREEDANNLVLLPPKDEAVAVKSPINDFGKNFIQQYKPSLPSAPEKSFQFLSDWRKLKEFPDLQYEYLKQFPANKLPVIFKTAMEMELFSGVIEVLSTFFVKNGEDIFFYLKFLSEVGRFRTLVMFLEDKELKALDALFRFTESSFEYSCDEIKNIAHRYGIS